MRWPRGIERSSWRSRAQSDCILKSRSENFPEPLSISGASGRLKVEGEASGLAGYREFAMSVTDTERIRALIDKWVEGAMHADVPRVTALYTEDVVSFDAIGPLRISGIDAWREHWKRCMEQCPGEMKFQVADVHIEVGGDVAFARFLMRCGATMPDGTEQTGWLRGTACYRCEAGEWKIAHDHCSVPFDPVSGAALIELEP